MVSDLENSSGSLENLGALISQKAVCGLSHVLAFYCILKMNA